MKRFKVLSLLLCVIVTFCSMSVCSFAEGENSGILGDVDGDGSVTTLDAGAILKMASDIIPEDVTGDMNSDGIITIDDAKQALMKASNVGGVVIPDKNGDNCLCDYSMDPNNVFLDLILSEFDDVDPYSLVAIYSVPDSGTNYVLQFKKTKGEYVKSPDKLEKVYHIGPAPEREISYTKGSLFGIGDYNCAAGEGALVFNLIKTKVMPQYPDYFTGV